MKDLHTQTSHIQNDISVLYKPKYKEFPIKTWSFWICTIYFFQ